MPAFCTLGGCTLRPLSSKVLEKRTLVPAEAEEACKSISFCKGFAFEPAADASQPVEIRFFGAPIICSWFGGSQNICFRLQLEEDRQMVVDAICESKGKILLHANTSEWLPKDRDFMLPVARRDASFLPHMGIEMRANRDVALAAILQDDYAAINDKLWDDARFVTAVVQENGLMLQRASDAVRADFETVLAAVCRHGDALQFAHNKLRGDRKIVTAAVESRVEAFTFATETLRSDKDFVKELIKKRMVALRYASDSLRSDKEFILSLIRRDERALENASDELRQDREFIKKIIETQGDAIRHAWPSIWEDADLILMAVHKDKNAIRHAGKEAWSNREFVWRMVQDNWRNLERASDKIKEDREIAKLALCQNLEALQYVGQGLKEDPEIIYLVYAQDESIAVRYADAEAFVTREFCLAMSGKRVPKEWSLNPTKTVGYPTGGA